MKLGLEFRDPKTGRLVALPQPLVSRQTLRRFGLGDRAQLSRDGARHCVLSVRRQGFAAPIDTGGFLVFKINPHAFDWEHPVRLGVQEGRYGVVLTEGGASAPRFTLEGNFGWVLKPVKTPAQFYEKSPSATRQPGGDPIPPAPARDGMQSWFALYGLVERYLDLNQRLAAEGKDLVELVWHDPLHGFDDSPGLRWVVTPAALPSLKRRAENQGVMPYRMELIGVYDDVARKGGNRAAQRRYDLTPAPDPKAARVREQAAAGGPAPASSPPAPPAPAAAAAEEEAEKPPAPVVIEVEYDFRFGTYATTRVKRLLETGGQVPGRRPITREAFERGVQLLLANTPERKLYLGRDAIAADREAIALYQKNFIDRPTGAKNRSADIVRAWDLDFDVYIGRVVLRNVKRGLLPWAGLTGRPGAVK